jgi:HKD family nuclease
MTIQFLGQGFEPLSPNAVGNHLLKLLESKDFESLTVITAFTTVSGAMGMSEKIEYAKKNFKNLTLITGIDQEGTSKEALYEILNLKISSYVFYQEEQPIFHPKIYLFEGRNSAVLILGSSNFTRFGLFQNVESSILVELDKDDLKKRNIITELKDYFKTLFTFKDPNLFVLTEELIEYFYERGIVPTEAMRKLRHDKKPISGKVDKTKIKITIPERPIPKVSTEFKVKPRSRNIESVEISKIEIKEIITLKPGILVWEKQNLPSSDAQQVKGKTKITGVVRLSDASFRLDGIKIDRNTYFRNEVFGKLNWVWEKRRNNSPVEVTKGKFNVLINKKSIGLKELKLSHDPDRISDQDNVPTTIHWGTDLISYLKKNNTIGMTLKLYNPPKGSDIYSLSIE